MNWLEGRKVMMAQGDVTSKALRQSQRQQLVSGAITAGNEFDAGARYRASHDGDDYRAEQSYDAGRRRVTQGLA